MSSFEEKRDAFINILICLYIVHLVGVSEMSWIKKDSSYFGLWIHCDKSSEYDCCQGSHTLNLQNKAWLHVSRTFLLLGAFGGFAAIVVLHFIGKNSSRNLVISMGILSTSTAICIIIGTGVFNDWYKKEHLLHEYQPHVCLALSYMNGFVYLIYGVGFLIYAVKDCDSQKVDGFPGIPKDCDSQKVVGFPGISKDYDIQKVDDFPGKPKDTPKRHHKKKQCPKYWRTYKSEKYVHEYERYQVDDRTFNAVAALVKDTWSNLGKKGKDAKNLRHSSIEIQNVERIENMNIFKAYDQKRIEMRHSKRVKTMEKLEEITSSPILTTTKIDRLMLSDIETDLNECYLFHGTKEQFAENIMKTGLDPRSGKIEDMFGLGIYAAESCSKSDQYTDSKNNRRQTGLKMFLIRVLLGKMHLASTPEQFIKPPCSNCSDSSCADSKHEPYDSVVAESRKWQFREFIVYDKHQCYPEYIITYNRI